MDKIVDRWERSGLLDNLSEKDKISLAYAMHYISEEILKDVDRRTNRFSDEFTTLIFPVLRLIRTTNPLADFNEMFLDGVIAKFSEFVKTDTFMDGKNIKAVDIDGEQILIDLFVELNYGQ